MVSRLEELNFLNSWELENMRRVEKDLLSDKKYKFSLHTTQPRILHF